MLDPFDYDARARVEASRYDRIPAGIIDHDVNRSAIPTTLFHSDPDIETLLFPHLYPYGRGQYERGSLQENGRTSYSRATDLKRKLNHIYSQWRNDWYWPGWVYQEIEQSRIQEFRNRMIRGLNKRLIDNQLPQHQLLQRSMFGGQNIINEILTTTIPKGIRTGESYFQGKQYAVNTMLQALGLSTLFVTLTFNESWPEYIDILRRCGDGNNPSNNPWHAIHYFYERFQNLLDHFFRTKQTGFGKLKEFVFRFEFQLRGAIHVHCLLWTENSVDQLLATNYVRADIPDPNKEPLLHRLVTKWNIHTCRSHICGGPGSRGVCEKSFPATLSNTTHHISGHSRYTYKRTTEAERWVVPYNPQLLLLWEGHMNAQYVTSDGLASYLTKYVTKGEPISVLKAKGYSHIAAHIESRRMGAMEVMVMGLQYEIFRVSSATLYLPTGKR